VRENRVLLIIGPAHQAQFESASLKKRLSYRSRKEEPSMLTQEHREDWRIVSV
jgi:hypothetical protein